MQMVDRCLFHDLDSSGWPAVVHSLESLALLYHTGTCHIITTFSAEPLLDRHVVLSALAPLL